MTTLRPGLRQAVPRQGRMDTQIRSVPGWSVPGHGEAGRRARRASRPVARSPTTKRASAPRIGWRAGNRSAATKGNPHAEPLFAVRRSRQGRRTAFPQPSPPRPAKPPIVGIAHRRKEDTRATSEDLPTPTLTAFTSLPPSGARLGLTSPGRSGATNPGPASAVAGTPLIRLIRLQRALRAATPCSTQSW